MNSFLDDSYSLAENSLLNQWGEMGFSMKHTHVIEAANAAEFKSHVAELYRELHPNVDANVAREEFKAVKEYIADKTALNSHASSEEPKRGRKKKEEETETTPVAAVAAEEDVFGGAAPSKPTATPYTQEDCQKRLQKVVEKFNLTKAKDILAKFKAPKLVDLKASDYSAFIGACDDILTEL